MISLKSFVPARFRKDVTTIPVVRLHGAIMAGGNQFRQNLNIATVAPLLARAFADKQAPAVAIMLNSPGGSPVQSRLIYKRIRDLAVEKNKKVLIFVEDVAASGGYMIACAGDEIFADPSSVVGSIGVISAGFGFTGLIDKIGVERRVYTAGQNKSLLDPFQPEKPEDVARLKELQLEIHKVFIDLVKESRGARLKDDPELFTGQFWTGIRGKELGLVDDLGDLRATLQARYGDKVKMRLITAQRGLFGRRVPGVNVGLLGGALAGIGEAGLNALDERGLWARYGL
ncbi:MAG: S49 family peptidase [Hoeflea sp.]|uniref:S49 family peptidase n=1 Tax=Hoeflea sp. TaxID=1940281 RepID=UPI001E026284|nr:S49 family peptidase [Hoeflea sp.]MBU4527691.1 S49 family peptidase [Alphaproteobacteria bacterium]MBU4546441.1 S49 family peptidase [Alphaproteobacteria bacterium]MBU4553041.1 S49 family peptidase [Alphaproteobacteria bacterium]MBV1724113.1 S49 family peptidase [Hoeflea sp.]MBV1759798.1 S49 family peptidase [Hoeflea sp.]